MLASTNRPGTRAARTFHKIRLLRRNGFGARSGMVGRPPRRYCSFA